MPEHIQDKLGEEKHGKEPVYAGVCTSVPAVVLAPLESYIERAQHALAIEPRALANTGSAGDFENHSSARKI